MEVGDDEVGVVGGEVDRRRGEEQPVTPPNKKTTRKPTANSIGVSKLTEPRHIVPIQLKNLIPVGTAMR